MIKLILSLLLSLQVFSAQAFELKTGDIVLQPLSCWSCSLIEAQENSDYAHMGIVVKLGKKLFIAEALSAVKLITVEEFLKRTKKGQKVRVKRLDYHFYNEKAFNQLVSNNILNLLGNPYDHDFRWSNEIGGRESLYCSEFVYKVLAKIIPFYDLRPKIMRFDVLPELWDRYFSGNTPRGEYGISPEDFNKSLDFYTVYEL